MWSCTMHVLVSTRACRLHVNGAHGHELAALIKTQAHHVDALCWQSFQAQKLP